MVAMQTCLKIKSLGLWLVSSFANKTVEQQLEDQFDVLAFSTTISNGNNEYIDTCLKIKSLGLWLVCSVANETVEQQLEDQFWRPSIQHNNFKW